MGPDDGATFINCIALVRVRCKPGWRGKRASLGKSPELELLAIKSPRISLYWFLRISLC